MQWYHAAVGVVGSAFPACLWRGTLWNDTQNNNVKTKEKQEKLLDPRGPRMILDPRGPRMMCLDPPDIEIYLLTRVTVERWPSDPQGQGSSLHARQLEPKMHQNQFIRFQSIAFTNLVTDGRTWRMDGRTKIGQPQNIMPPVCQSGMAEA